MNRVPEYEKFCLNVKNGAEKIGQSVIWLEDEKGKGNFWVMQQTKNASWVQFAEQKSEVKPASTDMNLEALHKIWQEEAEELTTI